jgi:hypothetical protein
VRELDQLPDEKEQQRLNNLVEGQDEERNAAFVLCRQRPQFILSYAEGTPTHLARAVPIGHAGLNLPKS